MPLSSRTWSRINPQIGGDFLFALRAYLLGQAKQFIVPIPGKPNGGRPLNTGYKLYGRAAGPTDFWIVAEKALAAHESRMKVRK